MSFPWADDEGVRQLAAAVKQVYKGHDLWRVLLDESCAESGPFDGGCLICAQAIIKANGSGELMRIVNGDVTPNTTDHYGARINGVIWDFNGTYATPKAWIKKFESLENLKDRQRFVDTGKDARSKIPEDATATSKIASLIADAIQSNSPNQTDMLAFKKWFGKSTVTDTGKAGGKPRVVYHGTSGDFSVFDETRQGQTAGVKGGYFFTSSKEVASDVYGWREGGKVMEVYLHLTKPMGFNEYFKKSGKNKNSETNGGFDAPVNYFDNNSEEITAFAKKNGHDGIMWPADPDSKLQHDLIVAFNPSQIKLAIANRGLCLSDSLSLTDHDATLALTSAAAAKSHMDGASARELRSRTKRAKP